MRRAVPSCASVLLSFTVLVALTSLSFGFVPKQATTPLDTKEYYKPDLHISTSNVPLNDSKAELTNNAAWDRFFVEYGTDSKVWIDPRSGAATNVMGHIPIIPGRGVGNTLTLASVAKALGRSPAAIDADLVAFLLKKFVVKNAAALGIDATQVGEVRADRITEELWQVSIPQVVNGIPVRYGRLAATINNGNLVLIGTENWGNASVVTTPRLTADEAVDVGFGWAEGVQYGDEIWSKPSLEIIPFAPPNLQAGESYAGPIGAGYGHRLAWSFGFSRIGDPGSWMVSVDANTGEVLEFKDANHYAKKKVTGAIYPVTDTGICPDTKRCGTMQPDSPMPWTNTGFPAPNDFTNSAGLYDYSSGTITSTLVGKYVRISDTCGAVNESSATGDLLFGGFNDQHDCTSAGSSTGNTPSSRSAFYELNKLAELARGWLPNNTWLKAQLPTNVNVNDTCNAFYSTSNGSVNFYKSGGGCRNTGEIAAVFDHEWGHALDDNDTNGTLSTTSESYADIAAIYRLQMSCVGYGFWWTTNKGCGQTSDGTGYNGDNGQTTPHCETDCSGVRGADWATHVGGVPDTPANFSCSVCNSGSGPCGREVHCDAMPATEAAWDFAARDLQAAPFNYDPSTAFMIANKVFYQGSGNVGNWHACTCPSTSDGCGSTNAYTQWLAADDDNGNINDGTPHMTALYAAFARHGIACATPPATNGGCAGGPTAVPVVTVAPGSNQVVLNWSVVAGATQYWVMRTEGFAGCEFGKALVATVPGTSYTDSDVANGRTYSYNVVAVGASTSCFGRASACVQATPQPCAGSISLNKSVYNCSDTVGISLVDSDLSGSGTTVVAIASIAEPAGESVTLTENPPGSGQFTGSIVTSTVPVTTGDGSLSVTSGDTITATYVDVSYCGTPNVPVTATAPTDCVPPVITSIFSDNITGSQAVVHWSTDEIANGVVSYGRTLPLTSSSTDNALVTTHAHALRGLSECSKYYYSVQSADPAGNASLSDNGGSYFTFTTGKNVNPSYASYDTPVAIPDNNPTGASSVLAVADTNTVLDVNLTVNITHTYDGDITLYLIGPDGTSVTLSNKRGSSGDNFTNTVFDDAAATAIASGTAPFTGSFRPDTPLSVFNNLPATGNWTLKVVDSAGSDVGTIQNWTLTLLYPAEDCGATLRLDADAYNCGSVAGISVKDTTLTGQSSLTVTIASNTETTPETVTLVAQPAPREDTFIGSIPLTSAGPASGDGLLSVTDSDTLTVSYIDVDDGTGGQNILHTDSATTDCVQPVISGVASSNITGTSAVITWATNEYASSIVHYGTVIPPASTSSAAAFLTAHNVSLSGLLECTQYFYSAESVDPLGNVATDNNAGSYYTFTTLRSQNPSYTSTDTPVAIPDNNTTGASSTIAVTDTGIVNDVNVTLNVTHTFDGDITLYLVGPNGTTVTLSAKRGSSGDNFTNTVFDDQATTPIAGGAAPFTGSFKPDTPLSALNGIPATGNWKLLVVDNSSSDVGTIQNWTLTLTYPAATCGAAANFQSKTITDSCQTGGAHSGDGVVDRGEDVVMPVTLRNAGTVALTELSATISTTTPGVTVTRSLAMFPNVAAGALTSSIAPHFAYTVGPTVPCGSDIRFNLSILSSQGAFSDAFDVKAGSIGSGLNAYPSTDVPKSIPDNNTTGATSIVSVTDTNTVTKVRVNVSITHTFDGDITLYLIGPNGTSVTLSAKHGSSGDNYTSTWFDDAATTAIASGSPPYNGTYRPDSPLTALNGIPANGTWSLKVVDNASSDLGTITAWALELTTNVGYLCNDCVLAVPSLEPVAQSWTSRTAQQWESIAGAAFYNVYRGHASDLPALLTPAADSCLRLTTTATATGSVLVENPLPGSVYWYLVRAANSAGEGPAGIATAGPRQQNSSGTCP